MDNPPQYYVPVPMPAIRMKTDRDLLMFILLSIVTFGIYSIYFFSVISTDINLIASRWDGRKTMHFCLLIFLVEPLTLGIGGFVWFHNLSNRIGGELRRRGIDYSFDATNFWLWNVLGSLIIIGPFVYLYQLCKALNLLSSHYNYYG